MGLMDITVDRVLSLAPSKFPKAQILCFSSQTTLDAPDQSPSLSCFLSSKTQLSFPTISTTPTTKTKTSSSSGWQKKKSGFFLLMISSQITTTKKFYTLHNENDDDLDADFSQLLMGLCIGLPSRQILIKNLNFLFWCSIWGMKCSTKYCCQNFQLMGIRLPCFTRSMKVSVSICG